MSWTRTFWRLVAVACLIQLTLLTSLAYIGPTHIEGQWDSRLGAVLYTATTDIAVIGFGLLLLPAFFVLTIVLIGWVSSPSATTGR